MTDPAHTEPRAEKPKPRGVQAWWDDWNSPEDAVYDDATPTPEPRAVDTAPADPDLREQIAAAVADALGRPYEAADAVLSVVEPLLAALTARGRCAEHVAGIGGTTLVCALLAGHTGQHHDDTTGADWTAGTATTPGAATDTDETT